MQGSTCRLVRNVYVELPGKLQTLHRSLAKGFKSLTSFPGSLVGRPLRYEVNDFG